MALNFLVGDSLIDDRLFLSELRSVNKSLTLLHKSIWKQWSVNSIITPTSYTITDSNANISNKICVFRLLIRIFWNRKGLSNKLEIFFIFKGWLCISLFLGLGNLWGYIIIYFNRIGWRITVNTIVTVINIIFQFSLYRCQVFVLCSIT